MSIQQGNPGIVTKDLQLYYNRESVKSFVGEATTNIVSNTTDFSGVSYAGYSTEWTSDPTRFTKSYDSTIQTPIGTGATLLTESGVSGYYHLSRLGGSDAGGNSISCYVFPVNGNIGNFAIGMLGDSASTALFNLVDGTVASTGVRVSNAFITKVPGWKGWYRVGANNGGRSGGWVGAIGLNVEQPITPTPPYKSMYVTGLQYEYKTYCTPFVNGSRSANTIAGGGGLLDLSGNNVNSDLSNVSFDNTGFIFNGSSNYLSVAKTLYVPMTISGFVRYTDQAKSFNTFMNGQPHPTLAISLNRNGSGNLQVFIGNGSAWLGTPSINSSSTISVNTWYNITFTCDGTTSILYLNGVNVGTSSNIPSGFGSYFYIGHLTDNASASEYFKGNISSFQLYGRSLTSVEVTRNFNAGRKAYGI